METDDRPHAAPRRVVITGVGVVSPLGCGVEPFWTRLTAPADPSAAPVDSADPWNTSRPAAFEGQPQEFGELPPPVRKQLAKSLKLMNRETQLGVAAGLQALRDSSVLGTCEPERIGIAFGAGNVGILPEDFRSGVKRCEDEQGRVELAQWGTRGISEVAPLWLLRCLPNMPACHLAILADLRGPSNTITEQALGTDLALGEAFRLIRDGDVEAMLIGGTGSLVGGLNRLHAYWASEDDEAGATSLEGAARGPAPSEGAGAFVLEDLESAIRRRAHIYGEVLAVASATGRAARSGGNRRATPSMNRAIELALDRSHLPKETIGHVHLSERFLPRLADSAGLPALPAPVVSARERLGNAGAGSGAMQLAASLLAIDRGELFASDWPSPENAAASPSLTGIPKTSAGASFLKVSRNGRRQSSCVAIARMSLN